MKIVEIQYRNWQFRVKSKIELNDFVAKISISKIRVKKNSTAAEESPEMQINYSLITTAQPAAKYCRFIYFFFPRMMTKSSKRENKDVDQAEKNMNKRNLIINGEDASLGLLFLVVKINFHRNMA